MDFQEFSDGLSHHIKKEQTPNTSLTPTPQYTKTNALLLPSLPLLNKFIEDDSNRDMVYWYILHKISEATKTREKTVNIFRFTTGSTTAQILEQDFELSIRDIQKFYIKIENYEKANICKKVLDRHRTNLLLDSLSTSIDKPSTDEHR